VDIVCPREVSMKRWHFFWLPALLVGSGLSLAEPAVPRSPAERGRDVVFREAMNPPLWSMTAYENAWKQWGLSEKPADFEQAFRERYGLHAAPHDNRGLPLGLLESQGLFGKGIVNTCLMCHAGEVAGQTIMGLGNSAVDFQTMFEELNAADGKNVQLPFPFSVARGTIDPISPVSFLMAFRDADLNLQKPIQLDYFPGVCSRPPAWWQIKRKKTRDWTGGIDARSTRVDLANLLTPFNSAAHIKKHEAAFADISAFLLTIEAPKYPFPIDRKLADQGQQLFFDNCARCHGTYGPGGKYPNKIVDFETLGTDSMLAEAITGRNLEHYNKSWFAQEVGPDGETLTVAQHHGYQAPPLDGVWATAPYFHNASVPTLYHVLNSQARPKIFTRSFGTGKDDYDPVRVGLKFSALDRAPDASAPGREHRKVYDTSQRGRGNGGHTFGDKLGEDERRAVIEYLKTL